MRASTQAARPASSTNDAPILNNFRIGELKYCAMAKRPQAQTVERPALDLVALWHYARGKRRPCGRDHCIARRAMSSRTNPIRRHTLLFLKRLFQTQPMRD